LRRVGILDTPFAPRRYPGYSRVLVATLPRTRPSRRVNCRHPCQLVPYSLPRLLCSHPFWSFRPCILGRTPLEVRGCAFYIAFGYSRVRDWKQQARVPPSFPGSIRCLITNTRAISVGTVVWRKPHTLSPKIAAPRNRAPSNFSSSYLL
jgi:hypothetical protein